VRIAFFGSSLVSAYWNGAATYYRGLVRALHERGHRVTFFEPDAFDRQAHRDLKDPDWAEVVVYEPRAWRTELERARGADVIVKASGVGVLDAELEAAVLELDAPTAIFWDVDAPATLARLEGDADKVLAERTIEDNAVLILAPNAQS
jgi:spore maturation protein CgeB